MGRRFMTVVDLAWKLKDFKKGAAHDAQEVQVLTQTRFLLPKAA